ncbi:MAG TPA: helix-turn-helix transcriptional regulator [Tepidisphaeraceae bacterium]|jgi:transcriptional regulator with XRE-family HTH domain
MTFGDFIKERRINFGRSLRSFCEANGYDAGNHSKLERGIFNPPDDDAFMRKLATALGVKVGSGEWFEMSSLASLARKQIPQPLLDDAEVAEKLPVLFRTLDGEPLAKEKMDELIQFIRSRQ